jgi:choline kinase
MIAVLLSAGKGERMYPLTKDRPKCLLDIGDGGTILNSQLNTLIATGFKKILIVAGYKIEQVQKAVSEYSSPKAVEIIVLQNPFYRTSNNIVSLWLVSQNYEGPLISINGDNVFKNSIIEKLLETPGDIVMTINRKNEYDFDDMLIETRGNEVIQVGKTINRDDANGESVGIIKYSKQGFKTVATFLENLMMSEENHQSFYLKALHEMMQSGFKFNYCLVSENDWYEVDFHPDVELLRTVIGRSRQDFNA